MASSSPNPRLRLVGGTSGRTSHQPGPTGDLDDAQLVALARENDTVAFEVLYRRHTTFAINLAIRIQGNATDVEDVVHDAFLRAHQRMHELREAAAFRSWLGSIVVRLVRGRLRRQRVLSSFGFGSADPVELDAIASSEAGPEARAQLAQIYALLRTMPADDRIAWTLRYIERHRLEAVAELAGCSLATAKRRIRRGQRFLADHFVSPYVEDRP